MKLIVFVGKTNKIRLCHALASLLIIALFLQTSCLKENYDFEKLSGFEWNPDLAAPLVHSRLTLEDILREVNPGDLLVTDSLTHILKVIYKGQAYSQTAEDLFPQIDQTYDTTLIVPMITLPPGDSIQFTYPMSMLFITSNGEILDSLWYDSGNFDVWFQGNFNHNMKLRLQIPGLRKGNDAYDATFNYNYTGPLPVTVTDSRSLQDYTCVFNSATAGSHTLTGFLTATIYGDNNPNNSPYELGISLKQTNIEMKGLFGYLGQQVISVPLDTIKLGLFSSSLGGTVTVDDPRLILTFKNSFGVPVAVDVKTLEGHSSVNPPYIVQLSGVPNPFFINAPTIAQVGQTVNTSLYLNKTNSNISNLLNLMPQEVLFALDATMNPSGNTVPNFVLKESRLDIDVDVEVPLSGTASGFTLQDTVEFSFEKINQLESIMFRLNILNGFPLDVGMQIYLTDSNYTILDSLLQPMERIISSGIPGPPPDYKVVTPTLKTTDITLNQSRLSNLFQTRFMILKSSLETSNGGSTTVKIYSDYYVDVKIGTRAKLKVTGF